MLTTDEYSRLLADFPTEPPPHIAIEWALERVPQEKLVVTTAFGMEGCVLLDLLSRSGTVIEVSYLDTHVLFPETYELRDRLAERYPNLIFRDRGTSLTMESQAEQHGAELWRRNPDLCCHLRKVAPLAAVLKNADLWMTAITREQSANRRETPVLGWDVQYSVLKLAPLALWTRIDVWEYVQRNDVPFNPLHLSGYPSIGCTHCTSPVEGTRPTDYSREGRWGGTGKTECGIHLPIASHND